MMWEKMIIDSDEYRALCGVGPSTKMSDRNCSIFYPQKNIMPPIEKVIFNGPATIDLWEDGEKTVVKCRDEDVFGFEYGLAMAVAKRYFGSRAEFEKMVKLPGVGVKTANVVLMEINRRPAYAVDTHVARISKRLGYAKEEDEPLTIEKKLEKAFPKDLWIDMHHRTIAFGRAICHAKSPDCLCCKLQKYCSYFKKSSSTKGR